MTCHDVRALFSDWADEALTVEDRTRVDAHLAQCADCRKELERFTATLGLLHRLERPRAPVGFVDRVLAAKPPAPWHRRLLQRLFLPLSVKLPAEAAALLLVAGLAVHVFQRTPELQRAARQDTLAPAVGPEAPRRALRDRPAAARTEDEGTAKAMREATARSTPPEAAQTAPLAAPPAPAVPPSPSGEHDVERLAQRGGEFRKQKEVQDLAARSAPEAPAAQAGRAPVEQSAKSAPPLAPSAGAAAPALRDEPSVGVKNEAKAPTLVPPSAPEPAPPLARPAPPQEGRADSERDRPVRSPARAAPPRSSAVRVLPSADVVGRLTVKDRSAAEQALGALLARSGGVVISRRDDAGDTVMEVAVPRTAYPEFSQSLARLGAWKAEGEPSYLPPDVRVTLRLVQ